MISCRRLQQKQKNDAIKRCINIVICFFDLIACGYHPQDLFLIYFTFIYVLGIREVLVLYMKLLVREIHIQLVQSLKHYTEQSTDEFVYHLLSK